MENNLEKERSRPFGILLDYEKNSLTGHLELKKGNENTNTLKMISKNVSIRNSLFGTSQFGKVSLLGCQSTGIFDSSSWGNSQDCSFTVYHGELQFKYVLLGEQYIKQNEKRIQEINFQLKGLENSVFTLDRYNNFGQLRYPDKKIIECINKYKPDDLQGELDNEKAVVSYFTGNWDYLSKFKTILGDIHIKRVIYGDILGRNMNDTPCISIKFKNDPTTLENALDKMREVRIFFAWIMGYLPEVKDIQVLTINPQNSELKYDEKILDVYSSVESKGSCNEDMDQDTLIDGYTHSDCLKNIMQKWLERNRNISRKEANFRFLNCFRRTDTGPFNQFDIIAAANPFELLPDEDKPSLPQLPGKVKSLLDKAQKEIKNCLNKEEDRELFQHISNDLNRINKNRWLREIIEHRSRIITNHYDNNKLEKLDAVIKKAVKCRNRYVHGDNDTTGDFSVEQIYFLTRTLEFIYGISELINCGWTPGIMVAKFDKHPLGSFIRFYKYKKNIS